MTSTPGHFSPCGDRERVTRVAPWPPGRCRRLRHDGPPRAWRPSSAAAASSRPPRPPGPGSSRVPVRCCSCAARRAPASRGWRQEAANALHRRGASVLVGGCRAELDALRPAGRAAPRAAAVGGERSAPPRRRRRHAPGGAGAAARDDRAHRGVDGVGAADQPVVDATGRLLEAAARPRPLVLVLDDLHWADAGLRLLRHLVERLLEVPLLVLATMRTGAAQMSPDRAATISPMYRLEGVSRLDLPGDSTPVRSPSTCAGPTASASRTHERWPRCSGTGPAGTPSWSGRSAAVPPRPARRARSAGGGVVGADAGHGARLGADRPGLRSRPTTSTRSGWRRCSVRTSRWPSWPRW